jgi:hypothetical protein
MLRDAQKRFRSQPPPTSLAFHCKGLTLLIKLCGFSVLKVETTVAGTEMDLPRRSGHSWPLPF